MILTNTGVLKLMQRIKSFIASQLNTKANSVHTHTLSEIDDLSSLSMGGGYTKSEVDTLLTGKADTSHTHTKSQITDFPTIPSKTSDLTNDSGFLTSHQDLSGYVPRSGGAVLDGIAYARTVDNSYTRLYGGTGEGKGAYIQLSGNNAGYAAEFARVVTGLGVIYYFENSNFASSNHANLGAPNYEWGQIYSTNSTISTSDARLKNSVKDIDDKLLDAWGNIEPKQYKFNDATETKGEQARFHTGYIAQDIQKACTDNNLDISKYGLFCYDSWEEEPEITEDVEVENDGVKTTEKRIIQPKREKGDMYALRYEETLVVECAYLRREINKLKEELKQLKTK